MKPTLTIILPTKDRPDFLERALRYYAAGNLRHTIAIAEASNPAVTEENKKIIEKFKGQLQIQYYSCHGLSVAKSINLINDFIRTPYATFIADDDFLALESIDKCIDFLEKNNDYVAAHGKAALFVLQSKGPYGAIRSMGRYRMGELKNDSASERFLRLFENYFVPLFSVHRLESWVKMWQYTKEMSNEFFEGELLPNSLSVIQGKNKKLNCLYLIRQDHDRRGHPDLLGWMTMPSWQSSYDLFRKHVTEELARRDHVEITTAQAVFKKAFVKYLLKQLQRLYQHSYGKQKFQSRVKSAIKQIPLANNYILPVWRRAKDTYDHLSLARLMDPSSPYYNDFLPIYCAISEPSNHPAKAV